MIDYTGPNQTEVRAHITKAFVDALGIQASSVDPDSVALGSDTTGDYVQSITGTANKIEVSGSGTEGRPVTLTLPSTVQIAQDLTVGGNLTVNGDLTYLNTTDLQIQDNLFELNAGLTGTPTNDSGMLIQRGNQTNQIFMWDESVDKFTLGATASEDGARGNISVTVGTLVANIEGNVTGDVTGDLTGDTTGFHTGDVLGDVTGDVTGTLNGPTNGTHTGQVNGTTVTASGGFTGTLVGNVTGDVTGNVTGDLTGDVVGKITSTGTGAQKSVFTEVDINGGTIDGTPIGGNVASTGEFTTVSTTGGITANTGFTGNLTGNVTGNVTGDVTGTVSTLSNHNTDDLAEGSNEYYTDAKVNNRIANTSIDGLSDVDTSTTAPTTAQVLEWDGNNWVPGDSGIGDVTLTGTQTLTNKTLTTPIIDELGNNEIHLPLNTGSNHTLISSTALTTGTSGLPNSPYINRFHSKLKLDTDYSGSDQEYFSVRAAYSGSDPDATPTTSDNYISVLELRGTGSNVAHHLPGYDPDHLGKQNVIRSVVSGDGYDPTMGRLQIDASELIFFDNAYKFPSNTPNGGEVLYAQSLNNGIMQLGWTPAVGTVSSVNTLSGAVVLNTDDIDEDANPVNLYYTDARVETKLNATNLDEMQDVVYTTAPQAGEVLLWDSNVFPNGAWRPNVVTGTGTVTSVTGGVGLTGGTITTAGTLDVDVGTTANKIVQLTGNAKLPAVDGSLLTNVPASGVQSITPGPGLYNTQGGTGVPITTSGQINVDVGTFSNGYIDKICQFDSSGRLPAVDGSQLTNLPSPTSLAWSALTCTPTTIAGYGITDAFDGAFSSLTGTPTTIAGYGITDAFDGAFSSLSGTPTTIAGYGITDAFDGDYNNLTNQPTIPTDNNQLTNGRGYTTNTGTVTSVDSGTGLTGGPITGSGTLNVDVGTGANQIVQLDGSSRLPAVDGSQLTGLPAGYTDADVDAHLNTTGASAYEWLRWDGSDYVWEPSPDVISDKRLVNPLMQDIYGYNNFGTYSGDQLRFHTNYSGWSFGATGPAENWNTSLRTKSWQDPGNDWINVYQLATDNNKNTFRINTKNEGTSVTAGNFVTGTKYKITSLGNTTQAQWEAAGLSSTLTAAVNSVFTATGAGAGTGTADTWDTGSQSVDFSLKGGDEIGFYNDGNLVTGVLYEIYTLGDTDWNAAAGTTGVTYAVGDEFTAANNGGSGTGVALDLRPFAGTVNSFAAFTSTSSTPHRTNLEIQANRLTFQGIHGDRYTFPRKDGTNGQVITTDGAGRLTFTTPPTQTVINNNADNRIITGSGTADNLNGEADFTWDGTNAVIDGTASNLTTPVLHLKTDNSNWFTGQLMCSDANGKVFTQVGRHNTGIDTYQWNITLDPDNNNPRQALPIAADQILSGKNYEITTSGNTDFTLIGAADSNVGTTFTATGAGTGTGTATYTGTVSYAGDNFVDFQKSYGTNGEMIMRNRIFGAHNGYEISVRGDFDGGTANQGQYKHKQLNLNAKETNFNCGDQGNSLSLTIDENVIAPKVPIAQVQLSSDPSNPDNGWTYYNTTTHKLRLYANGAWVDLNN